MLNVGVVITPDLGEIDTSELGLDKIGFLRDPVATKVINGEEIAKAFKKLSNNIIINFLKTCLILTVLMALIFCISYQ